MQAGLKAVDMDDAKPAIAMKAPLPVKGRKPAEGNRRRSFGLGDGPQKIKAAPGLATGESLAQGGAALRAADAGELHEIKADQGVRGAAKHLAEGAGEADETTSGVGLPEETDERRMAMAGGEGGLKSHDIAARRGGGSGREGW